MIGFNSRMIGGLDKMFLKILILDFYANSLNKGL